MGLFDFFKSRPQPEAPAEPEPREEPEAFTGPCYSHMRVEVTAFDGRLLFVARLMNHRGSTAELYQFSDADIPPDTEPLHVRIRGYHDQERKAIYMEGVISPLPKHVWQVTELAIVRIGNDRAFFRLDTDVAATATSFGSGAGERPCRMLNISVGGARLASEHRYWEGDKFLLSVRLLEDRDPSIMFCEVLRVIEMGEGKYEYGCRFLELNEADQDRITQNIFDAQRKTRTGSK